MVTFIRRVAYTIEDPPPRFQQAINDNVAQSFDDAFENGTPPALQLLIQTSVTNALTTALPPLLAPINDTLARLEAKTGQIETKLTRMETKLTRMETKLTQMETKLTRVEITQAKVSIPIWVCRTSMSNYKP